MSSEIWLNHLEKVPPEALLICIVCLSRKRRIITKKRVIGDKYMPLKTTEEDKEEANAVLCEMTAAEEIRFSLKEQRTALKAYFGERNVFALLPLCPSFMKRFPFS